MTTLEVVDSAESQAAVAYLLNLVMKRWDLFYFPPPPCLSRLIRCNLKSHRCVVLYRVPTPVLMSKFSDTTKALMDVMSKQATSDTASALRWVSRFLSEPRLFVQGSFFKLQQRLI